jgi:hypothetical protein
MMETAYNSLRDKLDRAGFTVAGPRATTPLQPLGDSDARAAFREASRGYGRAGTADMPDGPYMSMDDAAEVYTRLSSTPTEDARSRVKVLEEAAQAVEGLRREVPYEYNRHPCSTTMKRAAAAIRALRNKETDRHG